jgi:hypothetical protein
MRRVALFVIVALIGTAVCGIAEARSERRLTYRASQVWSSAVRFLRVDLGYKIVEKDKETGYLLFEYRDSGRAHQAALELIPAVHEGYRIVRARVRIEGMPSYVEAVLLDKFLRKLKAEYGEPPPAEKIVDKAKQQQGDKSAGGGGEGAAKDGEPEDEEDLEVDEEDLEDSVKEDD